MTPWSGGGEPRLPDEALRKEARGGGGGGKQQRLPPGQALGPWHQPSDPRSARPQVGPAPVPCTPKVTRVQRREWSQGNARRSDAPTGGGRRPQPSPRDRARRATKVPLWSLRVSGDSHWPQANWRRPLLLWTPRRWRRRLPEWGSRQVHLCQGSPSASAGRAPLFPTHRPSSLSAKPQPGSPALTWSPSLGHLP